MKLHKHSCSCCGLVWQHSGKYFNDAGAHTCPACGEMENWQVYEGEDNAEVTHPRPRRAETKALPEMAAVVDDGGAA